MVLETARLHCAAERTMLANLGHHIHALATTGLWAPFGSNMVMSGAHYTVFYSRYMHTDGSNMVLGAFAWVLPGLRFSFITFSFYLTGFACMHVTNATP